MDFELYINAQAHLTSDLTELTATALSGFNSSGSEASNVKRGLMMIGERPLSPDGRSSGYAGDNSASPYLLSVKIGLLSRSEKKKNTRVMIESSSSCGCNKRHKVQGNSAEVNFMAITAKQKEKRGAINFPNMEVPLSRIGPPLSSGDMSNVSHLISDKNESPFFAKSHMGDDMMKRCMDSPLLLMAMVRATSSFYYSHVDDQLPAFFSEVVTKLPPIPIMEQRDSEKEACSKSDCAISSGKISDKGIEVNSCIRDVALNGMLATSMTAVLSISQAMAISRHPRIITLATAPFTVLQVNAVFLCLAGLTSTAEVLGKPLQELIVGETFNETLKESFSLLQTVVVPGHLSFEHTKQQQHSISIYPIVSSGHDERITHFAIKLRSSGGGASPASSADLTAVELEPSGAPITAMG